MRILFSILLFFLIGCVEDSKKEDKSMVIVSKEQIEAAASDSGKAECIRPAIDGLLVRSDTAKDDRGNVKPLIKWYDPSGRLLMIEVHDVPSQFRAEKIYDSVGHMIYEGVSKGDVKFQCYQYKYDDKGNLVFKSGYSGGGRGSKTTYVYEGGKLVKEITDDGRH